MKHLKSNVIRCALVAPALIAFFCAPVAAQTSGQTTELPLPVARAVEKALPVVDTAGITGMVMEAANGQPIQGARVTVSGPELAKDRSFLTNDHGVYRITGLPAGHFTIATSKAGFLDLVYGQRRPFMEGAVMELKQGEQVPFTDCKLLRAGAIAGRITGDDGEPLIGATVIVRQYAIVQSERQLVPAGTAQTDEAGNYRVSELVPGDYYVNADLPECAFVGATPQCVPGVLAGAEAKAVAIGISQDVLNINFELGTQFQDR